MVKRVRLMAEYNAYPLWSLETSSIGPINPDDLPLSKETLFLLQGWSKKYQTQLNIADPTNSAYFNQDELIEFENEGIRLWLKLREELFAEFEVEYFSEIMQKHLKNPSELKPKDNLIL